MPKYDVEQLKKYAGLDAEPIKNYHSGEGYKFICIDRITGDRIEWNELKKGARSATQSFSKFSVPMTETEFTIFQSLLDHNEFKDETATKIYKIISDPVSESLKKVDGKWAIVSKTTGRPLRYYKGEGKPSEEWVKKQERSIQYFKNLNEAISIKNKDVEVNTWFERDRANVRVDVDGNTVADWWDDDVHELVQDGFLNPKDYEGSAIEYLKHLGVLSESKLEGPFKKKTKQGYELEVYYDPEEGKYYNKKTDTYYDTDEAREIGLIEANEKIEDVFSSEKEKKTPFEASKEQDLNTKISVPNNIFSQIDKRIAEIQKSMDEFDKTKYSEPFSYKENAKDALEKMKEFLKQGNLHGYKEAIMYYGSLGSHISNLFPARLVNFIHTGMEKYKEVSTNSYADGDANKMKEKDIPNQALYKPVDSELYPQVAKSKEKPD